MEEYKESLETMKAVNIRWYITCLIIVIVYAAMYSYEVVSQYQLLRDILIITAASLAVCQFQHFKLIKMVKELNDD